MSKNEQRRKLVMKDKRLYRKSKNKKKKNN